MREAGWAEGDIEIVPVDDTAYLFATWPGSDASLGPIVLSAHMDVVEARREDWERDPFTPVVENGFLYGRGASDTKFEASLAVASLIELRRQSFRPKRGIVIAYSGDEETTMKTSKIIADRLDHAHVVLNIDSASGTLSEETGEPLYWAWQGAEKTYIDFQLEVTNPGGHSAMPRPDNAIAQMSRALERISAYRFAPEVNDITRGYFAKASAIHPDLGVAAAMRAFAADPLDAAAIEVLRADPAMIGRIGTTCVPTMVSGGHAVNALPQRATAIVNCRVFPGHSSAEIKAELERAAATPEVRITDVTGDTATASPASPLRPEFISRVRERHRRGVGRGSGLSDASVGCVGFDVVSRLGRAQLRREPELHQGIRRLLARAQRAHPIIQFAARSDLLSQRADRSRFEIAADGDRSCPRREIAECRCTAEMLWRRIRPA